MRREITGQHRPHAIRSRRRIERRNSSLDFRADGQHQAVVHVDRFHKRGMDDLADVMHGGRLGQLNAEDASRSHDQLDLLGCLRDYWSRMREQESGKETTQGDPHLGAAGPESYSASRTRVIKEAVLKNHARRTLWSGPRDSRRESNE